MSPIPIGSPETALALAQEYDLKGKVGLSHDEVIVPVTIARSLIPLGQEAAAKAPPFLGSLGPQPYGSFVNQGVSGVNTFGGLQLLNPLSSGQLWIVSHVYAGSHTTLFLGTTTPVSLYGAEPDISPGTVYGNALPARTRDGRSTPTFYTDVGSFGTVATQFPGGHGQVGQMNLMQTSGTVEGVLAGEIAFRYVIPPGGSFVIQTTDDNNLQMYGVHFTIEPL